MTASNPEMDAVFLSQWTHDPDFMHRVEIEPMRPLSPHQIKKREEQVNKGQGKTSRFRFSIRSHEDDRLIGLTTLDRIDWPNGNGWLTLEIGSTQDVANGKTTEALKLILQYCFSELNLYRLSTQMFDYDPMWLELFQNEGFTEEVRRRGAMYRFGKRWDILLLGLLRREWLWLDRVETDRKIL